MMRFMLFGTTTSFLCVGPLGNAQAEVDYHDRQLSSSSDQDHAI